MATTIQLRSFLVITCAALLGATATAREPVGHGEFRFIGEVSMIPKRGIGLWRIASRQVTSDALTDIVTLSGPLIIGACVQVDMRRQKVLKIETLRPNEC